MEDVKPPPPNPPPPAAFQPSTIANPTTAAAPASAPDARSKKRKLDADDFRNSDYYKLRLLVNNLRPLFVEVLRAPDFQGNSVADDIQNQMKTMLELTKKLRGDVTSSKKPENLSKVEEPLADHLDNEIPKAQPETGHASSVPDNKAISEKAAITSDSFQNMTSPDLAAEVNEKAKQLEEAFQGTYVIGGSKLGWNFLVYPGSEAVYYGVTKESVLARRSAKSQL